MPVITAERMGTEPYKVEGDGYTNGAPRSRTRAPGSAQIRGCKRPRPSRGNVTPPPETIGHLGFQNVLPCAVAAKNFFIWVGVGDQGYPPARPSSGVSMGPQPVSKLNFADMHSFDLIDRIEFSKFSSMDLSRPVSKVNF